MINLSNLSRHSIWNVLKKTKSISYEQCDNHHYLNKDEKIISQVEDFEKQMKLTTSEEIFPNISESSLKVAGEMFLYLNSCPYHLQYWFKFYADLFKNKSPEVFLITLNRILKTSTAKNEDNKRLKMIANKLFTRATSLLSLKYGDIQNITKGVGDSSWKGGDKINNLII